MSLPSQLTIHGCYLVLDGGTRMLHTTDETGSTRIVRLLKQAFFGYLPFNSDLRGRLYLDSELIPLRSDLESGLLSLLRNANIETAEHRSEQGLQVRGEDTSQTSDPSFEEDTRAFVREIIQFVESEEYLFFADRLEQAEDQTQYDIWPEWTPDTRNKVLVRLSRLLEIGIPRAREILDTGLALATGISAMEVSDWSRKLAAVGLVTRVKPEFRWRLHRAQEYS